MKNWRERLKNQPGQYSSSQEDDERQVVKQMTQDRPMLKSKLEGWKRWQESPFSLVDVGAGSKFARGAE